MTSMLARICEEIRREGPISVERYMALCLFDSDFGYYTTQEPFGVAGDFTTAPEVSQMFGEMLAAWWVASREAMALPDMALAEIGPGKGTLMQDMLRAISKLQKHPLPAAHLVEASPRLAAMQREKLSEARSVISWHATPDTLPPLPLGIIANELFDAIPAQQYVKTANSWRERLVAIGGNGLLEFATGNKRLPDKDLPDGHEAQPIGQIFEIAPGRTAFMQTLARHIRLHGGLTLLIDYGHAQSGFGDTLQAVKSHKFSPVLDHLGEADLTSHVDFFSLGETALRLGLSVHEIMTQGDFLHGCGIAARAEALKSAAEPDAVSAIDSALRRLTDASDMGSLFKVLCVSSAPVALPPFKIWH